VAAFEAGAVDYLLKPIAADRLAQAVAGCASAAGAAGRARPLDSAGAATGRAVAAGGHGRPGQRLRWLSASVGDTIKMFSIDEVLFFQSDEKYTRVVTAHDEAHVRKPLREMSDGLDPDEFWQVHRGVIVRASAIARAQRDELGRITLHLKQHARTLPVSQAWAWRFKPM
jgi:DNA-binding LytR/AlgR family response regulator